MEAIEGIYGVLQLRNPVTVPELRLSPTPRKISQESRIRHGQLDWLYILKNWFTTLFGALIFFRSEAGIEYKSQVVDLTDTLVIDGRINTVIAGTQDQRIALERKLSEMEDASLLNYGLYVSNASIMSCYVRDRKDQHIHFVDGADGGYTLAARILKEKLAHHSA